MRDEPDELPETSPDEIGGRAMGLERLMLLLQSREVEVSLPVGLERRLRAQIHRMNAEIAVAADLGWEFFNPDDDLANVFLAAAERGIEEMERESGVSYDFVTGDPEWPIEWEGA